MSSESMSVRALNRALLARQGLLDRLDLDVVSAVEAIGPLQAQQWSAPPVALWSRMRGFTVAEFHESLAAGRLVAGSLLRATLHLVSAAEHPEYASVVTAPGGVDWRRTKAEMPAAAAGLRVAQREFAATQRTVAQMCEFAESWVAAHPGAVAEEESQFQRDHKWRPLRVCADLVRMPANGAWAKDPKEFLAAPPPSSLGEKEALAEVVRRHLRAFGPATAEDVAYWLGARVPVVRAALEGQDFDRLTDPAGRVLFDMPGALRPPEDTPAPARFLAAFDSALLAYHSARRERILPPEYKNAVYVSANLQVKPTVLVDGIVSATWSARGTKRSAQLTVVPCGRITAANRKKVAEEGEHLLTFLYPAATPTITWQD